CARVSCIACRATAAVCAWDRASSRSFSAVTLCRSASRALFSALCSAASARLTLSAARTAKVTAATAAMSTAGTITPTRPAAAGQGRGRGPRPRPPEQPLRHAGRTGRDPLAGLEAAQVLRQVPGGDIALRCGFLQTLQANQLQIARRRVVQLPRRDRLLVEQL